MIRFKPITLADKPVIQLYTFASEARNCDLSFANLFSWRAFFHTEYAEVEGFLLLRYCIGGEFTYMMPIGRGDVDRLLQIMIADAQQGEYALQLFGVSAGFKEWMMQTMPDQFDFSVDRNYAEYIYLRDDLITLKGKKLQAKRNHINRFKCLYPHYEYKTLVPTLIPECLKLEDEWCKANRCNEETLLQEERCSMTAALSHYEELQLQGGVLYVDGEIVAFTYGVPINHDTFDVCIEKANTSVEGAYAMINREFALRIPSQYNYINREEDMGLEGLRKAKRSYHPAILLESYHAKMKSLWRKK